MESLLSERLQKPKAFLMKIFNYNKILEGLSQKNLNLLFLLLVNIFTVYSS